MYEIMICPIKRLYEYAMDGDMSDVAVIAVSSYAIDADKLSVFSGSLCLNFDDITAFGASNALNEDTAERIAAFVRGLPSDLDTLFVCCDSGESRSTAMAAAIMRYKGIDDMRIWRNPHYHPNTLVYSLLCGALGVPVSKEELISKREISENALAEAINRNAGN